MNANIKGGKPKAGEEEPSDPVHVKLQIAYHPTGIGSNLFHIILKQSRNNSNDKTPRHSLLANMGSEKSNMLKSTKEANHWPQVLSLLIAHGQTHVVQRTCQTKPADMNRESAPGTTIFIPAWAWKPARLATSSHIWPTTCESWSGMIRLDGIEMRLELFGFDHIWNMLNISYLKYIISEFWILLVCNSALTCFDTILVKSSQHDPTNVCTSMLISWTFCSYKPPTPYKRSIQLGFFTHNPMALGNITNPANMKFHFSDLKAGNQEIIQQEISGDFCKL